MSRFGACWGVALGVALLGGAVELGRPGSGLRILPPELSLDQALAQTIAQAERLPRLRSLLVHIDGETVAEQYFHGARPERATNVKSVSKSILSALVGIAVERGLIPGVDAPIAPYFRRELRGQADPRKLSITVEDLLTMRSGLESTSGGNYGRWALSRSWVGWALKRPMLDEPGLRMNYSTGNTHLLSAIVTRASGESTWQFAQQALAAPLGFRLPPWTRDPEGIYFGGNDMLLTPRQMMRFGELYRNGGRFGDRQVIPEEWVRESFVPRGRSTRSGRLYGYGWWIRELGGRRVYYAWGYGGQFIFLAPQFEMVLVTTSLASPGRGRREHLGDVFELVRELIEQIPLTRPRAAPVEELELSGTLRPGVLELAG